VKILVFSVFNKRLMTAIGVDVTFLPCMVLALLEYWKCFWLVCTSRSAI